MTGTPEVADPTADDIDLRQPSLPPVARLATLTLALVVVGGIYMAANYGRSVSLVPPLALAVAGALVLVVNVVLLARIPEFAWNKFFLVFRWALLAYLVFAGILEFVFVFDHTPGRQLALFSGMLAVFAIDVPLILAFSVARYQPLPV
jgi:hypothetical protein